MKTLKKDIIKLQVPLRRDVKEGAEQVAERMGFSSLQEVIRVFLAGVAADRYDNVFASSNIQPDSEK